MSFNPGMSFNRWDEDFAKLESTKRAEEAIKVSSLQGPNIGVDYQATQLFNRAKTSANPMTMDQARQQATALAQGTQAYDIANTAGTAIGAAPDVSQAVKFKEATPVDAASSGMSTASWVSLAAKVLGAIVGDGSKQGQAARNPGNYQVALLPGYKGEEEDQPYYGI